MSKENISSFLKSTLATGLMFLLPLTATLLLLIEVHDFIRTTVLPLFGDRRQDLFILRDDILGIFVLIVLTFLGGLLLRSKLGIKLMKMIEDNFLVFIPGYLLFKTILSGVVGAKIDHSLIPVLVKEGESWMTGYLVEENKEWSTVMIIEAPRLDCAEVYIVPTSFVKKLDLPTHTFGMMIRNFGKGLLKHVEERITEPEK